MKKIILIFILSIIGGSSFYVIDYIREFNANKLLYFLKNLDAQEIYKIEITNDHKHMNNIITTSLIFEFTTVFLLTEKWKPHQPLLSSFYYLIIILKNGDKYELELKVNSEVGNNTIVYIYYQKSLFSGARYKNSKLYDWVLKALK